MLLLSWTPCSELSNIIRLNVSSKLVSELSNVIRLNVSIKLVSELSNVIWLNVSSKLDIMFRTEQGN